MEAALLVLHNLKKTFGEKTAVNIASLSIRPHTFTCIVGKSGCGKTTLLRLLAGLETPDPLEISGSNKSGSNNIGTSGHNNNANNAIINTDAPQNTAGFPLRTAPVFQEPRLMPWLTVKENIMFSLKGQNGNVPAKQSASEARCRQLLNELELSDAADLYPAQLSGGMAQRVSLGRTLFYDPELIFMDEPFSALDYFTRRNLQDMVLRLFQHQKKTILFVTHDVEEALLLSDRILVMENGSIKADMPVTLPFPRKAADPSLQDMRQKILDLLAE